MKRIMMSLLGMMMLVSWQVVHAEVVVIVNSANTESSLTKKQAKKIFLGKRHSFPGGNAAKTVDQAEGSATRDAFYKAVAKKSAEGMKGYWTQMIFSGKASPPEAVDDAAAVKAWVAKNKAGIGYIDKAAVDDSIKVLLTLP